MDRVKWRHLPTSYQILGGFAGAVGLLALPQAVEDGFLKTKLATYIDGYRSLVRRLQDVTVGWIDVGWLHMTEVEALIVSVSLILGSAALRAILEDVAPYRPRAGFERAVTAIAGLVYGLLPFALVLSFAALILPTPISALFALASIALTMWWVTSLSAGYSRLVSDPQLQAETIKRAAADEEFAGEPLTPDEIVLRAGAARRLRVNLMLAPGIAMLLALIDLALR